MKNYLIAVLVIFGGLVSDQVCATGRVWLSDSNLYQTLLALNEAGYLTVPGPKVQPGLKSLGTAFCGGLFFTLSTGAFLTLFTFFSLTITDLLKADRQKGVAFLFLSLLLSVTLLNRNGPVPDVIVEFLVVPATTALLYLKLLNREEQEKGKRNFLLHSLFVLVLVLLLFVVAKLAGADLFTGFRDHLLLSHKLGQKINDYYYQYTLYPAQVFKSLEQKNLKSCRFEPHEQNPALAARIKGKLAAGDYLVVSGNTSVDLTAVLEKETLLLKNGDHTILTPPVRDFLATPRKFLREFSKKTDRYNPYRRFTFISLLTGLPFLFYLMMHLGASLCFALFLKSRNASLAATPACFAAALCAFFVLSRPDLESIDKNNLSSALSSSKLTMRVAALQFMAREKMDLNRFPAVAQMVDSPHIAERYWLARAAGSGSNSRHIVDQLMADSHPNVVCQALLSFGKIHDKTAAEKITSLIESSSHWYVQWYAYRTLRRVGWTQRVSK